MEVAFVGLDRWVGEWVDGDDGGVNDGKMVGVEDD